MPGQAIPLNQLKLSAIDIFDRWLLLACGDFAAGQYNAMTISWGSAGVMWNKPFVMVVIRPSRYTLTFMERFDTFTLTAFPPEYKPALDLLGTRSGRDGNKIQESGLTPIPSSLVGAPAFAEAELILECRKIYFDDFNPEHFLASYIPPNYNRDFHRMFFGEIVAAQGVAKYQA